jgi:hypothetical protein
MSYENLREYILNLSEILWAQPYGDFKNPCIVVTKNSSYPSQLWDWGNWANNIALRQIAKHQGKEKELLKHEIGSVLNFLDTQNEDGSIEIVIFSDDKNNFAKNMPHRNMHKPVLCQHVAFILKYNGVPLGQRKFIPNSKNSFLTTNKMQNTKAVYFIFSTILQ